MIRHATMSGSGSSNPRIRSGDRQGDAGRAERLRVALRENLKRRKSQSRGRSQPGPGAEQPASRDSAAIVQEKAKDKAND